MKSSKSLLYFNLCRILDKFKVSNTELSKILNLSISTLSHKMSGKVDWKVTEMLKIQEYIRQLTGEKMTLDYLFQKG